MKIAVLPFSLGFAFALACSGGGSSDSECQPGNAGCICVDGYLCFSGLECNLGYCGTPGGSSTETSGTSSSDDSGSEGSSGTGLDTGSDDGMPPPPDPTCGENPAGVSGTLQTSVAPLDFQSVLTTVNHKRDIDPSEDGCINRVELTFQYGAGCTLVVTAGDQLTSNGMLIQSITFTADSQCPNFLDTDEGTYTGSGSSIDGSYIQLSQTLIGEVNVANSCFAGQMSVFLAGTLNSGGFGGQELQISGGPLVVQGDFPTEALDVACPVGCFSDTDCLTSQLCQGGACMDASPTVCDGNGSVEAAWECNCRNRRLGCGENIDIQACLDNLPSLAGESPTCIAAAAAQTACGGNISCADKAAAADYFSTCTTDDPDGLNYPYCKAEGTYLNEVCENVGVYCLPGFPP